MNKKIVVLGAVAVLGLGYVAATAYVGGQTEAVVRDQVAIVNTKLHEQIHTESSDDYARLSILSFEREVFKSEAIYQFEMKLADDTINLQFKDTYYHGPLPVAAIGAGKLSPMLSYSQTELLENEGSKVWFEGANGQIPLTAETVYRFGGGVASEMVLAPVSLSNDAFSVDVAKTMVHFDFEENIANHVAQGTLPLVSFKNVNSEDSVNINNIRFEGKSAETNDEVNNEYVADIESIVIHSALGADVNLSQVILSGEGRQRNEMVDVSLNYRIADARIDTQSFGSFELGTYAKNIDNTVLKEISALSSQAEENVEILEPLLHKLLVKNPELGIEPFIWRNSGGESKIEVQTVLQGAENTQTSTEEIVKSLAVSASIPRDMVTAILGSEAGFLSSMVEMIFDEKVQDLRHKQLITYENNTAMVDFQYDSQSKQVRLNGKTMSVDEFAVLAGSEMQPLFGF